MSSRLLLPCRLLLWAALLLAGPAGAAPSDIPVSGKPVVLLKFLDTEMRNFMDQRHIGAGTLTIMRHGRIVFHHAYGWKDKARTQPLPVTAMMRIASCTKPITATATRKLVINFQLSLNDKVFALNGPGSGVLNLVPFGTPDPLLQKVTVLHLLRHEGGWDRAVAGDLTYRERVIAEALGVASPPSRLDTARWIMGQPLQNDPDMHVYAYSNVGYFLLGLIIEQQSGQSYEDYVEQNVLQLPMEERGRFIMGRTFKRDQSPDEPYYYRPLKGSNVFYPAESVQPTVEIPYGTWNHEARMSQGRVVTDGVVMVRHAERYILSGPSIGDPRPPGGNRAAHSGSLPGSNSLLRQREDGINYAVLFNQRAGESSDSADESTSYSSEIRTLLDELIETRINFWPTLDVTAGPPTAQTLPATDLVFTSARLNGTVNTDNVDTDAWFEYGTSVSTLTKKTPVQKLTGTDTPGTMVSALLPDLLPGQLVYYRLRVKNELGQAIGAPLSLQTPRPPPVVSQAVFAATGQQVPGEEQGTTLATVFTPVSAGSRTAFRGTLRTPSGRTVQAILAGESLAAVVQAGGETPEPDTTFVSFGEPVLSESGFAFTAKVKRGRQVLESLWRYSYNGNGLQLMLLLGDPAPDDPAAQIASITSFSLRGQELVALVKYRVGGRVTTANATALLRLLGREVSPRLLLRQGGNLPGLDGPARRITALGVFTPAADAPGQGRSHVAGAVGVRATLANRQVINLRISTTDGTSNQLLVAPAEAKGMDMPSLGSPDFAAFHAVVSAPTASDEVAAINLAGEPTGFIAREGTTAVTGASNLRLGAIRDVVANDAGRIAFLCTLNTVGPANGRPAGPVVVLGSARALCVVNEGALFEIARVGGPVPDLPNIFYKTISHFGLPDGAGYGPVWTATLAGEPGVPVNAANNVALLAQDGGGVNRLLLRTGDPLQIGTGMRTVKSFTALTAGSSPVGGRRTIGTEGTVAARVVFTDGSTAIVRFHYPQPPQ